MGKLLLMFLRSPLTTLASVEAFTLFRFRILRIVGVGFDVRDKRNSGGLGLVSMAERISQVNGTFSIDSQLNVGTRIRARVPLAAKAKAMTNAAI